MAKPIQLDGSEGGGQMLRTALSLAMVTGQPFRMVNIRGGRRKPGLMRQHLACVNAACTVSDGSADGAAIGSTQLVFAPGAVKGGDYSFAIGTAGSTGLLFQTLFPALAQAAGPSTVRVQGGTHNPLAPPFEFLRDVFIPAVRRIGANANVELVQTGFAPVGGGEIVASVHPAPALQAIDWGTRGELRHCSVTVPVRHLADSIADRVLQTAVARMLPCGTAVDGTIDRREPGPGRGVACLVRAGFDGGAGTEVVATFGEFGVKAEAVGHRAGKMMRDFLGSRAAVGRHLADQLLVPVAMAGSGQFTTMAPDRHVPTNISVIERFLPVQFSTREGERGQWTVAVAGR